jgi:cysteine-rich repeat protein
MALGPEVERSWSRAPRRLGGIAALSLGLVAALGHPAAAKLCPYGRFVLTAAEDPVETMVMRLDVRGVTLEGQCETRSVRPRPHPFGAQFRMRSRWRTPCGDGRLIGLRARFETPCDVIVGVLRARRGVKKAFTATRIPECGNGYLDVGETCDDQNTVGGDCCASDCQAEPGCFIQCTRTAECNPVAHCVHQSGQCGGLGACWPLANAFAPSYDPCADGPVCGCDGTTYVSSCAAWAFGMTVRYPGACT